MSMPAPTPLPPVLQTLRERARAQRRRIVLPETADERVLAARETLEREGLAEIVWVPEPALDARFEAIAALVFERRKHKGMTLPAARQLVADPIFFAAGLVALGHADASVGGATRPTSEVIRAGLTAIGMPPGTETVSSMFLMVREKEVLTFADCGVVPNPDPPQLATIAWASACNHRRLTGEEPRIAFLSFSTKGSAQHPDVTKVREALEVFREQHPQTLADGELQFDAAYVPAVAERKAKHSKVAGRANVLVFPDLDAGNIGYKLAERLGGFLAFGPLLQGLHSPFMDLSRGCSAEDIVNVAVIASAMTQTEEK